MVKNYRLSKERKKGSKDKFGRRQVKRKKMPLKNSLGKNRKIKIQYADPLKFQIGDIIQFDITKYTKFKGNYSLDDEYKITEEDIKILNKEIEAETLLLEESQKNTIEVSNEIFNAIIIWKKGEVPKRVEEKLIQQIIDESESREWLTCRKIAQICRDRGIQIGKIKVNEILRKKLHYSYRKTSMKNDALLGKNSEGMKQILLKIIIRCLKLGYKILFLDETKIEKQNRHLKLWRRKNEQLYFNVKKQEKTNLTLVTDKEGYVYHKFNSDNNNTSSFLEFLEELKEELEEKGEKNYILLMDNCTFHVSERTKAFLYENQMNYLTNVPYLSCWNSVELAFRNIKHFLYRSTFSSMKELRKKIKKKIKRKKFQNTTKKNYIETLREYLKKAKELVEIKEEEI